jgi:hypothetical protein
MNKLGFYLQVSHDQDGLFDAARRIQPPVAIVHTDGLNRDLLRLIRHSWAPNAFIIGRMPKEHQAQMEMLEHGSPAENGRRYANEILNHDFGLAKSTDENGRLLINAWMSLNEAVPGPASKQFQEGPDAIKSLLAKYDEFQVAFRDRLCDEGIEAVAFNFASGNFSEPQHYLEYFPRTLASYIYLGFHEYGWPHLDPAHPGFPPLSLSTASGAGLYRRCMAGIRADPRFGSRHKVIITEVGLTREYMHPNDPRVPEDGSLGDLGWLNHKETLSEDLYFSALEWYNNFLAQDEYVLGGCLYEVGHSARFRSHRHLGIDNAGHPLDLVGRIVGLKEPPAPFAAAPVLAAGVPQRLAIKGKVTLQSAAVAGAIVRLVGSRALLKRLRRSAPITPEGGEYALQAVTSSNGRFRFAGMPPGAYRIEVLAPGAQTFITGVSAVGSVTLDITLQPTLPLTFAAAAGSSRSVELGVNIDPRNRQFGNPSARELLDLGVTWVRFVFKNSQGQDLAASYGEYDSVVDSLAQNGISILMILNNESCPGKPEQSQLDNAGEWQGYTDKFAARCRDVAQHYGDRVAAFQIWNEPDHPGRPDYEPTVREATYGRLLRASFEAIKSVSGVTVITAGMQSGDPGWVARAMAGTGGVLHADALSIHPYGQRPEPGWPPPGPDRDENGNLRPWGFGLLPNLLSAYRNVANKPIWLTELGTNDISVKDPPPITLTVQDQFPERAVNVVNSRLAGVVSHLFWFCWSDGMVEPFGLVRRDNTRKRSYAGLQSFAGLSLAFVPDGPAVAALDAAGAISTVVERPSVHYSARRGYPVHYIIVHSTDSPAGAPALATLNYLVKNDRGVSVHELVLPDGVSYRLVNDGLAAHHCESASVQFPDGSPANLANEITWGIEAYQIHGQPVGEQVVRVAVERVAAACRRFGLGVHQVLAHREIDPARRSDPVGIDMEWFRSAVAATLAAS